MCAGCPCPQAEYIRTPNPKDGTGLDLEAFDAARGRAPSKLLAFSQAVGLDRVLAAAVHRRLLEDGHGKASAADGDVALQYLKGLDGRQAVAKLICTPAVADALVGVIWAEVQTLQQQ